MEAPLLKTKLYVPPLRPGLLPRPRLMERLDEGLRAGNKLTLISAPAGSGKTTLLVEWVHVGRAHHDAPLPVAWVSLDEGDNDPARFLAYTGAALRQAQDAALRQAQDAAVGAVLGDAAEGSPETLDPAGLSAMEPALIALINEIADLRPGLVLAFDDYHLIENREIHEGVAFLLDHLPPDVHLVIATRADPPLPLARLRARGRLTELRYEELRFRPDEVTGFLNEMMKLDLSPEEVQALDGCTEGWIAGLHLAALSLRGRADVRGFIEAFSSSHHYVLEYLTEETLSRLPEGVARFLLQTSILDRLCGSLCDAVTGEAEGEVTLARLYRDNLFLVPLDDEHVWYRYHPLFADLLLKRLMKGSSRERADELRGRASRWHEEQGSLDEAVTYALRARDYGRALGLVEEAATAGALESRLSTMLRWLEAVPDRALLRRPRLCIYQAWSLVINEQLGRATDMARKSAEALASVPPSAENEALREELGEFLTVVEMMGSLLAAAYSGQDLDEVCERALEARGRALEAGNPFMAAHILNGLAMGRFHQGRLAEAAGHYRELVALGHQGASSQVLLAAVGHIGLAAVGVERDELEAAGQHLNEGVRLGGHRVGANTLVSAAVTRSRLREYAGDRQGAWAALDEAARIRRVKESGPAGHRLTRQRVWLHLAAGEVEAALRQAQDAADRLAWRLGEPFETGMAGGPPSPGGPGMQSPGGPGTLPPVFREAEQIVQARLSLRRGEPGRALAALEEPEGTARAGKRAGRLIEIHLLQALACQAQGRSVDALGYLERSLGLAEPEGYVRVFLDEGEPAAALLRGYCGRQGGVTPPLQTLAHVHRFAKSLLEAFEAASRGAREDPPAARPAPIEPLTRRQREVLRLLAEGLSAPEIAQELVVAPSTVRSHLKAVYRKLDAHGRREAVERARALGLA